MIQKTVGGIREIKEYPDVRKHRHDRFPAFQNIDVFLHIDFIQFRTFEQCDLFHQDHSRELEFRDRVQNAIIDFDFRIRIKAEQGTKFDAAVFITADVVGQTFFHFHELLGLVIRPERGYPSRFGQIRYQLAAVFAVRQQFPGNVDRSLRGRNLEIDPHRVQHKILFRTPCSLLTEQHAVVALAGVEEGQSEIQNAQRQIHIQIVDGTVLALGVTVRSRPGSAVDLSAG